MALILAAGMGTRLQPITLDHPKCLVEVAGKTLIARQIETLRAAGVDDIRLVVGYQEEKIRERLGPGIQYRFYPDFAKTNNLHTLWQARDWLGGGFLCLFSDVIFSAETIRRLLDSPDDLVLAVDASQVMAGTMRVKIADGRIAGVGSHIPVAEGSGTFIGLAKFSAAGAATLLATMAEMIDGHQKDYYTMALDRQARDGGHVSYVDIADQAWIEIDTLDDLNRAELSLTSS